MINRDEQKSFFMIDPAIVEDNKKSYAIQESYKETYGLDTLGINPSIVHRNLSPTVLIEKAIRNGEGILTDTGALAVTTGKFTGRSPHDKYIVDTDGVHVYYPLYPSTDDKPWLYQGLVLSDGRIVEDPSCEGGNATGTHLHIARKYNGEWVQAYGPIPFDLSGWIPFGGESCRYRKQ